MSCCRVVDELLAPLLVLLLLHACAASAVGAAAASAAASPPAGGAGGAFDSWEDLVMAETECSQSTFVTEECFLGVCLFIC